MKHKLLTSIIVCALVLATLTSCTSPNGYPNHTATGVLTGTAIGAGAAALLAGGHGHAGEAAVAGGAMGAIAGGLIGQSMDQVQAEELRTHQREAARLLAISDVKALAHAGMSDEVIISQIRNSNTSYQLNADEIIDLKNNGVSDVVINFMINTPGQIQRVNVPPSQSFPTEPSYVAPGPAYIWIDGMWFWQGDRWIWIGGHWDYPINKKHQMQRYDHK